MLDLVKFSEMELNLLSILLEIQILTEQKLKLKN